MPSSYEPEPTNGSHHSAQRQRAQRSRGSRPRSPAATHWPLRSLLPARARHGHSTHASYDDAAVNARVAPSYGSPGPRRPSRPSTRSRASATAASRRRGRPTTWRCRLSRRRCAWWSPSRRPPRRLCASSVPRARPRGTVPGPRPCAPISAWTTRAPNTVRSPARSAPVGPTTRGPRSPGAPGRTRRRTVRTWRPKRSPTATC